MLVPKSALIATGEEGQEAFDGTILFVEADRAHVEIDDLDLANRIGRHEEETGVEPSFLAGDQEWEVDDDE